MTIRPIEEREIPSVQLTGVDGNAFMIMGTVRKAMREADWTTEEIDEVMNEMMSGDYNNLLCVAGDVCDVY